MKFNKWLSENKQMFLPYDNTPEMPVPQNNIPKEPVPTFFSYRVEFGNIAVSLMLGNTKYTYYIPSNPYVYKLIAQLKNEKSAWVAFNEFKRLATDVEKKTVE